PDPAHHFDHLFIRWDGMLLHSGWVNWLLHACAPWLQRYLELCYLFCYPMVPLAFLALYLPAIRASREAAATLEPFRATTKEEEQPGESVVLRAKFRAEFSGRGRRRSVPAFRKT